MLPTPSQSTQPDASSGPRVTTSPPPTTDKPPKESIAISAPKHAHDAETLRPAPLKKFSLSHSGVLSPLATVSPAASRSASPVPSLEAILLDRKRRLAAAAAAGKDPNALTAPASSKAVPSAAGERTGVVIAEKVKQDIKVPEEDVRIPGEMDKAGPDKKEDSGYL
ncbi:hypothetical protein JVU11DRAFT_7046 [Chiua virens]|nr:hypothetical protein JVU11DRAFT_7046 [Chiua virens]